MIALGVIFIVCMAIAFLDGGSFQFQRVSAMWSFFVAVAVGLVLAVHAL